MKEEFLMVHKSILPSYYDLVIEARELIERENASVSDVCKRLGISRSTYYKYKDYIFHPGKEYGKKAILSVKMVDKKGVLSTVLNTIAMKQGNIITINQNVPIRNTAFVTLAIDVMDLCVELNTLVYELKNLSLVKSVELLAFE